MPSVVLAHPTFTPHDTAWLTEGDIWDCLRLLHDSRYVAAVLQPSYNTRHHPVLNSSLIANLSAGPPDVQPTRRNEIALREVLADSLGVVGSSAMSSPNIVIGDQTHYRTLAGLQRTCIGHEREDEATQQSPPGCAPRCAPRCRSETLRFDTISRTFER